MSTFASENNDSLKIVMTIKLPRNFGKDIAYRLKCTKDRVYKVRQGIYRDAVIELEILRIGHEYTEKMKKVAEETEQLLNKLTQV